MEQIIKYLKARKFVNTEATFEEQDLDDRDFNIMRQKESNLHWFSPSGETEFVLTEDFKLYRRGKFPVRVNGCNWELDTKREGVAIGRVDIDQIYN